MEKHLNVKEELPLFNDSDIEKLCEQFIEYIEKKVKYREEWFENKEIIKKKVWDVIHNILLDIEKYLDSEEMSEGLVLFNNLDINKLCEQFIWSIENKVKDCKVSGTKWLENKETVKKKTSDAIYNILLDTEKYLDLKEVIENLTLFNDSDIDKLYEQFIEYIERKVRNHEKWLENKVVAEKKIRYVIYNTLLDIEKYLNSEGLALFNFFDIEKLYKQISNFLDTKVMDYNNLSYEKWFENREEPKEKILKSVESILLEAEKYLNLNESIPYSEQEKGEVLESYKYDIAEAGKNFTDWLCYCMDLFVRYYSKEVLCVETYEMCYNNFKNYRSGMFIRQTNEIAVKQSEQLDKMTSRIEAIRLVFEMKIISEYTKALMEWGDIYNKIILNDLKEFYESLQFMEKHVEKKDVFDKEKYTEDYMLHKWENIIYYILIGEQVILSTVLQQTGDNSIEKKNIKLKRYTEADIKNICSKYKKENGYMVTSKKFHRGIEVCAKFDKRIQLKKEKTDDESNQSFKISFPSHLEKILKEVCLYRANIPTKDNDEEKKIYLCEILDNVITEIRNMGESKENSISKIIYDSKISNYYFSYEIFNQDKMEKIFTKEKIDNDSHDSILDFECVENWNGYTGQLIINCIWKALIENNANDFFILATNNNDVIQEEREQFDKALYWSIEEVVKLTSHFGHVATAYIAECLYSCVGMFAEAIEEDFSFAIRIFTSLALALQKMQIPEMYKFWKSCSESNVNNDIKTEIKRYLDSNNDYKDFFIKKHSKIDTGKLGGVRTKKRILYNKIAKAVLFNLYDMKIP